MSTHDSYSARHLLKQQKQPYHRSASKSKDHHQSSTHSQYPLATTTSISLDSFVNELHAKVSKIEHQQLVDRFNDMDNKIANLTHIVKLVQKYTEAQDVQYEREKQLMAGRQAVFNTLIAEYEKRVRQEDLRITEIGDMCHNFKDQLQQMEKTRNNFNNHTTTTSYAASPHYHNTSVTNEDLMQMLQSRDDKLRKELNRKVEVCMNQIQGLPTRQEIARLVVQRETSPSSSRERWSQEEIMHEIEKLRSLVENVLKNSREPKPILKSASIQKKIEHSRQRSTSRNKYVTTEEYASFKEETDRRFNSVIDKFEKVYLNPGYRNSQIVKKYVVGRSTTPPPRSEGQKSLSKRTESEAPTITLNHNDKSTIRRHQDDRHSSRHPNQNNIYISEYSRGRSKHHSKTVQKNKSEEKERKQGVNRKERSKSVSRKSSISSSSNNVKRVVDKRKQKEEQLKEMIKKSKKNVQTKDSKYPVKN